MGDCSRRHAPFDRGFVGCSNNFGTRRGQANMVARESDKRPVFDPCNSAVFGTGCSDLRRGASIAIRGTRGSTGHGFAGNR